MSRTRASRALIALLCVTIALGMVAYFRKPKTTTASEQPKVSGPDVAAVAPGVRSAQAAPKAGQSTQIALGNSAGAALITQTPGVGAPVAVPTGTTPVKPPVTGTPAAPTPAKPAVAVPAPAAPAAPAAPVNAANSASVINTGKSLIESANLLEGRRILNDALISGALSEADAESAKALISKANETLIFSPRRVQGDSYVTSYNVQSGDKPLKIAAAHDVTWEFLGRINNISDPRRLRAGAPIKIVRGPLHAVVSKSKYTMDLYLGSPGEKGSLFVKTLRIGHGKDNSTPVGAWMVTPQNKLKNPKWWGSTDEPVREADDPLNPLGEFWLGLTGIDGEAVGKQGFGIHGTIEPDSIGKQMSHGCIRLVNADVQQVYEMLVEGKSTVIVKP